MEWKGYSEASLFAMPLECEGSNDLSFVIFALFL